MNMYKKIITGIVAASLTLALASCGGKNSSGPSFKAGVDPLLVTLPGEAWIDIYYDGQREGFTLEAGGAYRFVSDITGAGWTVSDSGKVDANKGVIKTNSGQLYYGVEEGLEAKYKLADDVLTITTDAGVNHSFSKTVIGELLGDTPLTLIKGR